MIGRVDGPPVDPYFTVVANQMNNMKITAAIVFNTLRLNKIQQQIADATPFEQNFQLVNLTL